MKEVITFISSIVFAVTAFGETEPNNQSNDSDRLLSSIPTYGQLSSTSDVDWFVVNVSGGSELTLEFGAAYNLSTYANWNVAVYRPSDGATIADYSFTSYGSTTETRHIGIDQAGDFLIAVYSRSLNLGFSTEDYVITAIADGSDPQSQLETSYEGIWETNVGWYATVNQKGDELAIILLGADEASGYNWEAQMGVRSGPQF